MSLNNRRLGCIGRPTEVRDVKPHYRDQTHQEADSDQPIYNLNCQFRNGTDSLFPDQKETDDSEGRRQGVEEEPQGISFAHLSVRYRRVHDAT